MVTIYDADTQKSIEKIAEALKGHLQEPEWAKFVKTGPAKERPPVALDWYFMRAASILRTVYLKGPIGVEKLRMKYGSKKNRGHSPEKFYKGSGKILRTILQQCEKAGLVEFQKDKVHKGRVVTAKGQSLVDKCAVR
ncbi:MAG: 30S ribosomal protein S19e [Candidatus Nanoarchaeia archaeon]